MKSACSASHCACSIGLFTFPQPINFSLDDSRTMNLSFGERPVCCPVRQTIGPSAAMTPSCFLMASSYSAAVDRFHFTRSVRMPSRSSWGLRSTVLIEGAPVSYEGPTICDELKDRTRGVSLRQQQE